ncbi:MAG: hypothetical protein HQM07_07000 [Zetaproteobacteria bacterium]|nr:hypothetical protein [Zetaproteobacteria bacterium]
MSGCSRIAVALVHYPVLNPQGERATTAITAMDIHDFARTAAFYNVSPVYFVHPAAAMQSLFYDVQSHWLSGKAGVRNPARREMMRHLKMVDSLDVVLEDGPYQVWYTSANPPVSSCVKPESLMDIAGNHLIVFGTGSGLDLSGLPDANGWLSALQGVGSIRHLSVRAALSIYLDRLYRSDLEA